MSRLRLKDLRPEIVNSYKEEGFPKFKRAPFFESLAYWYCLEVARKDGIPSETIQLQGSECPPSRNPDREGSEKRNCALEAASVHPRIWLIISLALETGMRRGEIAAMQDHIDWTNETLHIPDTKNGYARTIPLTSAAINPQEIPKLKARVQDDQECVGSLGKD